jgi:DNA-binding NarL/FixJ family response regulator
MQSISSSARTVAPLRLLLVDPNPLLRAGLKSLLELDPALHVVGDTGDFAGAVALAGHAKPGLIIVDAALPGKAGVELIAGLRQQAAGTPLLVLSADRDIGFIRAIFGAGAMAYVLKEATHAELLQGIRAVAGGRRFLCEIIISTILTRYAHDAVEAQERSPEGLITDREREVLRRVALGQSNKHAARDLGLSVKTVEKHRSNLMRKLKLHNTAALTMFAIRHGVVEKDQTSVR